MLPHDIMHTSYSVKKIVESTFTMKHVPEDRKIQAKIDFLRTF